MADKTHRLPLADAVLCQARGHRHPSAMEAEMAQPNLAKEAGPDATGLRRHFVSHLAPAQCLQKRNKIWVKSSGKSLSALGIERDAPALEINLRHGQAGLAEPTTLMNGDLERDAHPLRLFDQMFPDRSDLSVSHGRLDPSTLSFNAEPETRIDSRPAAPDRFVHDEAQDFDFRQHGLPGPVRSIAKIIDDGEMADLGGADDVGFGEEVSRIKRGERW